jgi:hypothetical protein
MYAVLISILLLIAMLFYTGKDAAKRMLLKYHVIAGLPVMLSTLGTSMCLPSLCSIHEAN